MEKKNGRVGRWEAMDLIATAALCFTAVVIIIPFWNAIVISFETNTAYARNPFTWLPGEFTLQNYELVFKGGRIPIAYGNTILITLIGTVVGMAVMIMAAYAFSRSFPGKKLFFLLALFTMYFSGGLVPTYLLMKGLHLLDTRQGVILISLVSVYHIIIMKNGFESTPAALQEAAMIDGADDWKILWYVLLPLQKPLIATFSLFTAVSYWNSWYWPMLLLNKPGLTTLQLFLRTIINGTESQMREAAASGDASLNAFTKGIQMASVVVVIVPILFLYPFLQKYFVKGMMIGAVKM